MFRAQWNWYARGVALLVMLVTIAVFGIESQTTIVLIIVTSGLMIAYERSWRRRARIAPQ